VNRVSGASGIVADDAGTIYAADVGPHRLRKYVKVRYGESTCVISS
jgi:NHL repeat